MHEQNTSLTPADVRRAVAYIDHNLSGDDESQHAAEDSLYVEVLEVIRDNCEDEGARELAAEALKARDLKFKRWCA